MTAYATAGPTFSFRDPYATPFAAMRSIPFDMDGTDMLSLLSGIELPSIELQNSGPCLDPENFFRSASMPDIGFYASKSLSLEGMLASMELPGLDSLMHDEHRASSVEAIDWIPSPMAERQPSNDHLLDGDQTEQLPMQRSTSVSVESSPMIPVIIPQVNTMFGIGYPTLESPTLGSPAKMDLGDLLGDASAQVSILLRPLTHMLFGVTCTVYLTTVFICAG